MATIAPTTTIAGAPMPAPRASAATRSSRETRTRSPGSVTDAMIAAGVSGAGITAEAQGTSAPGPDAAERDLALLAIDAARSAGAAPRLRIRGA